MLLLAVFLTVHFRINLQFWIVSEMQCLRKSIELSLFIPSHYCIEISSLIIFSWVSGKEKTRFMLSILDLQRSTEIHQHTSTFHTEQSRRDDME
ncbi:hypothetical protein ZEAMMB73_Zm00001d013606 [Zea mays]|uniref:Uncharacterized protein n=1 Tax=Zea mays TaxID=4577 RepID=A0A1D6GKW9_MAIZE|nr:hypothetical protein ZEAMMB73_Zm00001d013606 [Zea mays]